MTIPLYPEIIYEGDLSPDDVGEEIEEKVEVSGSFVGDDFGNLQME